MSRVTTHQASDKVAEQQPFKTSGSFSGDVFPEGFNSDDSHYSLWRGFGNLPIEYKDSARGATYVVFSYQTPIAWVKDGEWVFPDVKYSITTSRHQSETRWGMQRSGLPVTYLGESSERKKQRVRSSTGGGWGS